MTAAEFINKFGSRAKHKAIYSLIEARIAANSPKELLMREVFHQIMLSEQKVSRRALDQVA